MSSGINTTINGAFGASDTSLTLTSNTGFPGSGSVRLKITVPRDSTTGAIREDEIFSGTISGSSVTSITRPTGAIAHTSGAAIELYEIDGIPLDQINRTHTSVQNVGIDSYTITTANTAATQTATATTATNATAGLSLIHI